MVLAWILDELFDMRHYIMLTHYLKLFYALFLLLSHASGSILGFINSAEIKCIEREREALLNFKHGLKDDYGMLSIWRDDENSRDSCQWKAIQCHHQTAHVTILSLLVSIHNIWEVHWILLIACLAKYSTFGSQLQLFWRESDPRTHGLTHNLRYLNLSHSEFGGSIPAQLGNLTHLRHLDLNLNHLEGKLPYQLANLSQLRYLDLSYNFFTGALPFQVGNLPFLHTLGLGGYFDVKPKDAHWLSNLRYLTNLAFNRLHNPEWLQTIIFPNLRELRLVHCSLSEADIQSLFYSYSNFSTSLTILDLSYNMLTSSTF